MSVCGNQRAGVCSEFGVAATWDEDRLTLWTLSRISTLWVPVEWSIGPWAHLLGIAS